MALKSNFKKDLEKEKKLSSLLDSYYTTKLKHYTFKRITDLNQQYQGVDLIFEHKKKAISYSIDEKAQLDYINENLPTFAFEISYKKDGIIKGGWLFDKTKKTQFYSLITSIYSDTPSIYYSCKITLVNRNKLINFLKKEASLKSSYLKP